MTKVLMLVANNWETDSRVIREASAISQSGLEVHVICQQNGPIYQEILHQNVTYHCLPALSARATVTSLPLMFWLHAKILAAGLKDADTKILAVKRISSLIARLIACFFPIAFLALLGSAVKFFFIFPARVFVRAVKQLIEKGGYDSRSAQSSYRKAMAPIWFIVNELRIGAQRARLFCMNLLDIEPIRYLNQFGAHATEIALKLKPAVVHSHDLVTLSGGFEIAKKLGAKLVYDAHELETHTNYWSLQKGTKRAIEFYERVLIRRCDATITVCNSIADWLAENYDISRPIVVQNSPDIKAAEETAIAKERLRDRIDIPKGTPLAVYVGSVTIDRGLVQCVQALSYAPELHIAFVGPRYIETEKEIVRVAAELGVRNRIHLVDPVPSAHVTSFISDADCSIIAIQNVCLSYYFCFPNKLLESVLADIPVVVARLIELENFVSRFHTGLVANETDPEAIAQAIQKIIANRQQFLPTAEARKEIVAEYGWSNQKRKLLNLYSDILLPA